MSQLPGPVEELLAALSRLPGIGPRSAERLALHLVQTDLNQVRSLAQCLVNCRERVGFCSTCGALTESQPCKLCADDRRDGATLCVVERPVDILSLEKASAFKGKYHVLGGKLSPLNGIGPEDLRIQALEDRVRSGTVKELVLALSSDVEGDATSHYLAKRLTGSGVRMTRLAQGLPAGAGLDFADALTLSRALEGRQPMGA